MLCDAYDVCYDACYDALFSVFMRDVTHMTLLAHTHTHAHTGAEIYI